MKPFSPQQMEKEVSEFWSRERIYEKVKASRIGAKRFYFIDGPPYASGNIHVGTAFNKILKDAYTRFWRMQGFNVWDQPGYDTHGTPIEIKVERELGFKNKKDIEKYGVDRFVSKCREFATRHIDSMSRAFANIGVWQDWENPYLTLNNRYIEGAWFTFKRAFERGFLYRGSYPVHTCSRCETVVAYNEIEHRTLSEKSIYVKFPVKGEKNTFLVIWTTTPWTIPANTGVMVHPDFQYAFVKSGDETLVVANELVQRIMTDVFEAGSYRILKRIKGRELKGMQYEHPLKDLVPAIQNLKNAHRVVLSARYVNLESGTGLVHTAPGHGTEDFIVGREAGLPVVSPVNIDGTFREEAGEWLAGRYTKDMDQVIVEKLREREALISTEEVSHEYPICWRCKTPLLFINVPQWFFRVEPIKKDLLKENKRVNWNPRWAQQRFHGWLENLGDWPVSRQRYWGIPLPIWECPCGRIEVIGSWDELRKKGRLTNEVDFHKPEIDSVVFDCPKCKAKMKRVPDVLDVWFDSGVCSWASLGYPRDKRLFDEMWPTDLQMEGTDQFRGWWNSQLLTSYFTFRKAPFKNILMHGIVMDAKGVKMSKSVGNIVAPEDVIEKYGRDVLRFYLLSNAPWNNFFFKWDDANEIHRIFAVFWNIYMFVKAYTNPVKERPPRLNPEDRWILSRFSTLLEKTADARSMNLHKFAQDAQEFFLNDFSRWYIKLVRDRVSPDYRGKDRAAAEWTLRMMLKELTIVMAPFTPYITEAIYTDLFRKAGRESVHMEDWPRPGKPNKRLEADMETVKGIVEAANAARQKRGIKLRWPVSALFIMAEKKETEASVRALEDAVMLMANVSRVEFKKALPGGGVPFNGGALSLGDVLMEDAMVRELIRNTQLLRKENRLDVAEKIAVWFKSDEGVEDVLKKKKAEILQGIGAAEAVIGNMENKKGELEFEGKKIEIGFRKV